MPSAFRKHRHLIVALMLALFPVDVFSDITETVFYKTVLPAHLEDVAELISIVAKLKAEGADLPVLGDDPDNQSARYDQFIDWITKNCTLQSETEDNERLTMCYHRIGRLRFALDQSDYLSRYTRSWMGTVMSNWETLDTFGPGEARTFPHILPLPYEYRTAGKVAEYAPRTPEVRQGPISHDARPIPYQELSYTVDTTPRYDSESSSLPVAVADFVVNRASQEMIYGLLTTFVTVPDDDSDPVSGWVRKHLGLFAPAMVSVLETLRYSQINTLVPALRSAAADDIRKAPERLIRYTILYTNSPKDVYDLRRIHDVLDMVRSGLRPDVAMSRIPRSKAKCDTLDIARTFAKEWYLSKGRVWGDDSLTMNDAISIGGYTLSVVLERKELRDAFMQDDKLSPVLGCVSSTRLDDFVLEVFERLRQLDALLERASDAGNPDVDLIDVLRLTSEFIVFSGDSTVGSTLPHGSSWLEDWVNVYLAAANYGFSETVSAALRYVSQHHLVTSQQPEDTARVLATVLRLITLGANLAEAETSEEFQAVLYAAADPVGSFVTKRQPGEEQWTIGAYLGGVAGGERKLADGEEWAGHFGLALPIGLEWSTGLGGENGRLFSSIGIFVSPIDLGAIASYRVHDLSGGTDSLESAEIGWRQLLSPSVYVVLGLFDNLPLAIGGGVQYAPWARKQHDGMEMRMIDAIRISMLLAVDVALLRL